MKHFLSATLIGLMMILTFPGGVLAISGLDGFSVSGTQSADATDGVLTFSDYGSIVTVYNSTVYESDQDADAIHTAPEGYTFLIAEEAKILSDSGDAIEAEGADNTIINAGGWIFGGSTGVLSGYNSMVMSAYDGEIVGDLVAVDVGSNSTVLNLDVSFILSDNIGINGGDDVTVVNEGSIGDEFFPIGEREGEPNTDAIAINLGDNADVTNLGTIASLGDGVVTGNHSVVVNAVNSAILSDLIEGNAPSTAIHVGDDSLVVNDGLVFSETADGIVAGYNATVINSGLVDAYASGIETGSNSYVENSGTVLADKFGMVVLLGNTGISVGNNSAVLNDGLVSSIMSNGIAAGYNSVVTNNGFIDAGIDGIHTGADSTITNSGEIFSDRTILNGIGPCGIEAGSGSTITNDGLIVSFEASGITTYNSSTVTNNGTISAWFNGINAGDDVTIINNGIIGGDGDTISYNSAYIDGYIDIDPVVTGIDAGAGATITNNGFIMAEETGIAAGDGSTVTNATGAEIFVNGGLLDQTGIHVGDNSTVTNDGFIYAKSTTGIIAGYNSVVTNEDNGIIDPAVDFGIYAGEGEDLDGQAVVTNYGSIGGWYGSSYNSAYLEGPDTVYGPVFTGIKVAGDDNQVYNKDSGRIIAYASGIEGDGSGNTIVNDGIIAVGSGSGITAGDEADVTNNGEIFSSQDDTGIHVGADSYVENNGFIDAGYGANGIYADYNSVIINGENGIITVNDDYAGIHVNGGSSVTNAGWIGGYDNTMSYNSIYLDEIGEEPSVIDIDRIYIGVYAENGENTITNTATGKIFAIDHGILANGDNNTIINQGGIDTYGSAIYASGYNSTVLNDTTGEIFSDYGDTGIHVGENGNVTNRGYIYSDTSDGIYAGYNSTVFNDGGIIDAAGNIGIDASEGKSTVINDGWIGGDAVTTSYNSALLEFMELDSVQILDRVETGIFVGDEESDLAANYVLNDDDGRIFATDYGILADGDDNTIINRGLIDSYGSGIYAAGYNSTVLNDTTGKIYSDFGATGIHVGDGAEVTNHGLIVSEYSDGIYAGADSEITNTGFIDAYYDGIIAGYNASVLNMTSGEIYAQGNGEEEFTGIYVGAESYVYSDGIIESYNSIGIAVGANSAVLNDTNGVISNNGYDGIYAADGGSTITNDGAIGGNGDTDSYFSDYFDTDMALDLVDTGIYAASGGNIISNTYKGVIYSNDTAIEAWGGDNTVTNNGLIYSDYGYGIEVDYNSTVYNNGVIDARSGGYDGIKGSYDLVVTNDTGGEILAYRKGIKTGSDSSVTNDGYIYAGDSYGIHVGMNSTVLNDVNGIINAPDDDGIYAAGSDNTVINRGLIGGDGETTTYNSAYLDSIGEESLMTIERVYSGIYTFDESTVTNDATGRIYAYDYGIEMGGSDNIVTNQGMINSYGTGINSGYNSSVLNSASGEIFSDLMTEDSTGIHVGDYSDVTNAGLIYSQYGDGIYVGYNSVTVNTGTIATGGLQVMVAPNAITLISDISNTGIYASGGAQTITNYNAIGGDGSGFLPTSEVPFNSVILGRVGTGIYAWSPDNEITNEGSIYSYGIGIEAGNSNTITNAEGALIDSSYENGISARRYAEITNAGTINSGNNGINALYNSTVINTGIINADVAGIRVDGGSTTVINDGGQITGAMAIRMLDDGTIENSGVLIGNGPETNAILTFDGTQEVTLFTGAEVTGHIVDNQTPEALFGDVFILGDDPGEGEFGDLLTFDGEGTYNYNVVNFERVYKTGDGTWVLTGDIDYGADSPVFETVGPLTLPDYRAPAIETAILEGTLQIDGTLGSYETTIYNGATLAGDGTIWKPTMPTMIMTGTVYNYGSISPGPATGGIGALDIIDNLESYGDFHIELDYDELALLTEDAFQVDKIDALSTYIEGGSVTAVPLGYLEGGRYTFLETTGLDVEDDPMLTVPVVPLVTFELGYDETDMWLDATRHTVTEVGGTPNQEEIYDTLREEAGAPDGDDGFSEYARGMLDLLDSLEDPQDIFDILGSRTGEHYPNLLDLSMAGSKLYRSVVSGRMGNLHLTSGPRDVQYATNTVTKYGPANSRLAAYENRAAGSWSGWARALTMQGEQDKNRYVTGYDFDVNGVAVGFDNQLSQNFALGVGFGMASTGADFNQYRQNTDIDTYHAGLYGTYSEDRYYIDTALLYASNDYDSRRIILTLGDAKTARSSTEGSEWGLYLGGGVSVVDTDSMFFIPTASIEWASVNIDGFAEKGADVDNLNVDDYDADSVVTTLGFRWGGKLMMGESARFEPELRVAWAHEFGDTDRSIKARFDGSTTTANLQGIEPEEDSALIGLGANFFLNEQFTLFLDYDGELRDDFDAHAFSGGIRYNF